MNIDGTTLIFFCPLHLFTDFLIDGRRSMIGGLRLGGLIFNLNNGTKTLLIIVKISENTFLGMTKVRAGPILTLAMP